MDSSIARYDGADGRESWRYNSAGLLNHNWAVRSDGTIFVFEYDNGETPKNSALVGINGTTGLEQIRVPIPSSVHTTYGPNCSLPTALQFDSFIGPPMIDVDGSVHVEADVWQRNNDLNCSGNAYYYSENLRFLKVASDGTPSWSLPFDTGGTNPTYSQYYLGATIPDGQGGLLANWTGILFNCGVSCQSNISHVTHITASGNTDYTLPVEYPTFEDLPKSMVLGENGTAFAAGNNQFASFDIASGTVNWTWTGGSGSAEMIAASAGNGLVVRDGTHVTRLDSTGAATYDSWTGNSIQYAFGDMWLTLGSAKSVSADEIACAAGTFSTLMGYLGLGNSEPPCAPLPSCPGAQTPCANEAIYAALPALVSKLTQDCPLCQANVFDKVLVNQADFASYLPNAKFYDGTKSQAMACTALDAANTWSYDCVDNRKTVAVVFWLYGTKLDAATFPHSSPLLTFFRPAAITHTNGGITVLNMAMIFHEGFHGKIGIDDSALQKAFGCNHLSDTRNITW